MVALQDSLSKATSDGSPLHVVTKSPSPKRSLSPLKTTRRFIRRWNRPVRRIEAMFLLVVSMVFVYICKSSTRSYVTTVHYDAEWMPVLTFTNAKRRRRVIHSHYHLNKNATKKVMSSQTSHNHRNNNGARKEVMPTQTSKPTEFLAHPQVLFYCGKSFKATKGRRIRSRYELGSLRKRRQKGRPSWSLPTNTKFCVPMKSWQTTSFPTCNRMHEISLSNRRNEEMARVLGTGGWRATWKVDTQGETVAYKTLKWKDQTFDKITENRHRIDAVSTERLTSSKHVIDIYGYCGQSVINEFAEEGSLEDYVKKHKSSREKLQMARDVAKGVADLHDFEGVGNATIVHKDLKPANIVIIKGQLKLNDFNDAEFLNWNTRTNRQCPFRRFRWTPTYHSPEEVLEAALDEKLDVFALGAIIFFIMTGRHPYKSEGISKVRKFKLIAKGVKATLPTKVERSTDPAIVALRDAFLQCQSYFGDRRPNARDVARELDGVLTSLPSS